MEAEEDLGAVRQRLEGQGLTCQAQVVQGDPAAGIIAAAGAGGLVAMTMPRQTGRLCWALGSVAERVTQGGPLCCWSATR